MNIAFQNTDMSGFTSLNDIEKMERSSAQFVGSASEWITANTLGLSRQIILIA